MDPNSIQFEAGIGKLDGFAGRLEGVSLKVGGVRALAVKLGAFCSSIEQFSQSAFTADFDECNGIVPPCEGNTLQAMVVTPFDQNARQACINLRK